MNAAMVHIRKTAVIGALLVLAPLALSSCTLESFVPKRGKTTDVVDRPQELSREDFDRMNEIDSLIPEGAEATATVTGAPPIPDMAQVLAAPKPPKLGNSKLVTLAVTDDVPLRDVLFELGRLANVDIEVGSGLDTQGINLRATNRPFNEVIERISDLAYLRYSVQGDVIRVERDTPYLKNYPLDFLNIVRSSNSSYQLSTTALSAGGSSGGGSSGGSGGGGSTTQSVGTSGSSASIQGQSEGDLWSSMEASLTEILNYDPRGPQTAGGEATTATGGTPAAATPGGATNFVINRQVGVLSVNATERQHAMIQRFLTLMTRNASSQVLIEAKIVEVSLRDQFLSGVDWNKILGSTGGISADIGTYTSGSDTLQLAGQGINIPKAPADTQAFTFGLQGLGLDTVISMTEQYGTTRTLSSPRLSAINNQQAVLTFAENRIFFNCTIDEGESTTIADGATTTSAPSIDCPPSSVPIGIILTILPSINPDTQEITLSVRPTLTRQVDTVQNPGVLIAAASYDVDVPADVPIIEVREIDSIMKIKSGGVMIIGGLMEDANSSSHSGVPGAMDLPLVGNMFKSRSEDSTKRELIILIKATIVSTDGNTHPADRGIYRKFTTDPRPAF